MYQLWGGGAPFRQLAVTPNNQLQDRRGTSVQMLGDVSVCFAELHARMKAGEPLLVGVASRSDEPEWARECLSKFIVAEGVTMMDVVSPSRCEIYKGSKRGHFKALQVKTQVPFSKMCFFDDDPQNIADVGGLGVHCFLTPNGVTKDIFNEGLKSLGLLA